MKAFVAILFLFICSHQCTAQKETFDLVSYTVPKNWNKIPGNGNVFYSHINKAKKTWCMNGIYQSTASTGNIDTDFNSEWQILLAKDNSITAGPVKESIKKSKGYNYLSGGGKALFDRREMMVHLTVFSNNTTCISIVSKTNDASYLKAIDDFRASIEFSNLADNTSQNISQQSPSSFSSSSFQFISTNWNDGYITYAKENWADITNGNTHVLIHYPNKNADAYNSVLKDGLQNAWNILVSPRYNNIHNFELKPIQSFESIAFCEADATEKETGKNVHIVLFKKHYSNGNGRYLEFITSSKSAYEQEFGAWHNDEFGWEKPAGFQYRNKFAVANSDLNGKWSASDYASLSYYYVSSGGFAGATATSIAHSFTFQKNLQYTSDHSGASGVVGNQQFSRQVYKGKFNANNWSLELTNRFQGATEKYDCYFEAVKGGRILILTDKHNTVYSLVTNKE